jgi:CRISPR-associated protein Csx14
MTMPRHPYVLLATLGGQPQIVTFTLDLLLSRGFLINEVIVIHPEPRDVRLRNSLHHLREEFASDYYNGAIRFQSQVLQLNGEPLADISHSSHADGTLDTIHRLICELKCNGRYIHMSVTGGLRLMGLLAVSVAALNFDHHDAIWHLYTPKSIRTMANEGAIMHMPTTSGIKLIRGPFILLGAYIYAHQLPFSAAHSDQRSRFDAQEEAKCAQVVKKATPAQLKVLKAFSRGLKAQQIAAELQIQVVTVHSHKTALLRLCHMVWNIDASEHLNYHFLQTKFANYFDKGEPDEIA